MQADDLFMFITIMACIFAFSRIVMAMIRTREARHLAKAAAANPGDNRSVQLLSSENERLNDKVGRLEERIAVLERIATDRSHRIAEQIESLR
jgi:hypothetical protein